MTSLEVEEDFQHPELIHSTGQRVEFDVYIEEHKLAFEYQGEQHYKPVYWTSTDFGTQRTRDEEKRQGCTNVQSYETELIP